LRIFIKKVKTGERYLPTRKTKIWSNLEHDFKKSGPIYIRVTYAPGYYNHGEYDNRREAGRAMKAFIEKELVKEMEE